MTDQPSNKKLPSAFTNADQPTVIAGKPQAPVPAGNDFLTRVEDLSGKPPPSHESLVTKVMSAAPVPPNDQTRATDLHVPGSGQTKGKTSSGTHHNQVWGDFELGALLGRGGMGSVYRGRQISLDRPVAIKVLPSHLSENENFRQRFQLEAKSVAQISSPHVVGVYFAGQHDGHHYFAMEYVEGKDLGVRLRDGYKPTHREALDLVIQAARGLAAAGDFGIVHRDIKPGNMMVTSKGLVKLMDFGLVRVARSEDTGLTMAGTIMGTVSYFSPEQGRGERCDCRTDIYALGVVFYELLTRRLPFSGGDATSVIYQHIHQEPKPLKELDPTIPEAYQAVVLMCLQKDPANRYQTAADLLTDLEALGRGLEPSTAFHQLKALRTGGNLVKSGQLGAEKRSTGKWWMAVAVLVVGAGALVAVKPELLNGKLTTKPDTVTTVPSTMDQRQTDQAKSVQPKTAQTKSVVASADPSEARRLLAAADFVAARGMVNTALALTPQDTTWLALGKDIDEAQGSVELKRAEDALAANELDAATASLGAAARLLGDDMRVTNLKSEIDGRSDSKRKLARTVAEAENQLNEGNPAKAEALLTPIVAGDPANEAAAILLRRVKKELDDQNARAKAVEERLAQGEDALARKDIDAALLHFTAAQQFDPKNPRAAVGLEQVTKTKGALTNLRVQFEQALKERNLLEAEGSLKSMRQLAPGSATLVLAENEFTNSKLVEETQAKAASDKEAAIVAQATTVAKLMDDPSQTITALEQALLGFLERHGANRPEKSALEAKLEDRCVRVAVSARLADLDIAVVKNDQKAITAAVFEESFRAKLLELAQESEQTFVSTVETFTRTGDTATALVAVRHAMVAYPERTLKLTYTFARQAGAWVISGASLNP